MNNVFVVIVLGVLLIACGVLTITKKWLWLQQGLCKRPVQINKYTKYMGIIDILCGLILVITEIIYFKTIIPSGITFLIFFLFISFIIFGEIKFRKKD